mmetsp:Transcript_86484/g.267760  ORF Transcript_86484/g.267760 Transcript_86484/m.267760 type:complete len:255 (+) Transcript_86484:79-843(+)
MTGHQQSRGSRRRASSRCQRLPKVAPRMAPPRVPRRRWASAATAADGGLRAAAPPAPQPDAASLRAVNAAEHAPCGEPAPRPLPTPAAEAPRARREAAEEPRQQAELDRHRRRESEDLQREKDAAEARQRGAEAALPAKTVDAVVQAFLALRKAYKDTDLAGLTTCLQTLRVYINNLARNPHDPKFQRINCDNNAFRTRVAAFEGATAVLIACGFQEEEGALVVGPDFVKTKGSRLWDALAKVDVMIEQLKGGT